MTIFSKCGLFPQPASHVDRNRPSPRNFSRHTNWSGAGRQLKEVAMGKTKAFGGAFRRVLVLLLLAIAVGLAGHSALANVKKAIMNVDLKNPGSAVSQISFPL